MNHGVVTALVALGAFAALITLVRWRLTRVSRRLLRFLGAKAKDQVVILTGTHMPHLHEADALRALRDGLPALGLAVESVGLNSMVANTTPPILSLGAMLGNSFPRGFGVAQTVQHATGPGKSEELPSGMMRLCSAGARRLAIVLMKTEGLFVSSIYFEIAVTADAESRAWAKQVLADLETWMSANSIFRKQSVAPSLSAMGAIKLDFVDVSLSPEMVFEERLREELDLNFLAFVRHRDALGKMGIPSRRGLLLCGPPGCGKTSTCRYLRTQLPEHAFFILSSRVLEKVKEVFELAARVAPSVVVIEDVDLALRTPDPALPNPLLKDLLNEMDGIEDRADVMVVLTSNSRLPLEQALADRPGRIDHTIRYSPPGAPHRKNVLATAVRDMRLLMPLDDLVKLSDGLTAAQLIELVKKSAIRALRRAPAEGAPEVSALDVRAAFEELTAGSDAARGVKDSRVRPFPTA